MRTVVERRPIEHPIIEQASKSSFKGLLGTLLMDLMADKTGFIISDNGPKISIAGKFATSRHSGSSLAEQIFEALTWRARVVVR